MMAMNNGEFSQTPLNLNGKAGMHRKLYSKPELVELGDLRTLTLGPSIGVSDSPLEGAWNNDVTGSSPQSIQNQLDALSTPDAAPTPGYPINLP
jgi:hypothetical protein